MAKAKRKGGAGRSQRAVTGRIRIRANVSERRATVDTPGARDTRERIRAAIDQGRDIREGILARIDRALELPASGVVRRAPSRRRA